MRKQFLKQNYAAIKKKCLQEGTLFEDPEFTADGRSLVKGEGETDIDWLRPKEICRVPKLIVEGVSSDDLVYDDVTRAWFATACMALARDERFFAKVIPDAPKQEFSEKNPYAGIFKFSIWRLGEWTDVVVDDRLPTRNGQLVYCRSGSNNEFWSALLEKAYAKLHGGYHALLHGETGDALVDFTGGILEKIDFRSVTYRDRAKKNSVFKNMLDAFEDKSLISCYIAVDPTLVGTDGPTGLVNGLGYVITMVKEIECKGLVKTKLNTDQLRLIRLFSPNTQGRTWKGRWSQSSAEMSKLSVVEWEKIGVKYEKEDEFWMCFQDFLDIFTRIDVCHFLNTSFFSLKKSWSEASFFSSWCSYNNRDGGGDWASLTVLANPQFVFDVHSEKDTVVVSLDQKEVTHDAGTGEAGYHSIGFYILRVEQNRKYRVHLKHELKFKCEFSKSRNVFGQVELDKGRYVIVACCMEKGCTADFLLRLYTGSSAGAFELKNECPSSGCCLPKYKIMSNVEVQRADGLKLPEADSKGTLDPFVVILCEGQKVTSEAVKNTGSPIFNCRATFYRKHPAQNIVIEVYNKNTVFNTFIGQGKVKTPDTGKQDNKNVEGGEDGQSVVVELFGKKKEESVKMPGKVHVFMRSSNDLSGL